MEGCLYFFGLFSAGLFCLSECAMAIALLRSIASFSAFESSFLSLRSRTEKLDLLTKLYFILTIISDVLKLYCF